MRYGDRVLYLVNDQHTFGAVYGVYFNVSANANSTLSMYLNNEVTKGNQ